MNDAPYVLLTIPKPSPGVDIVWDDVSGRGTFISCANIDGDGCGGNPYNDPDYQDDTTEQRAARDGMTMALNSEEESYIVLPPGVIIGVKGIVLGCKATVFNARTGQQADAVVGDVGPHSKIGEISIKCASLIGVDPNPVTGGEQSRIFRYAFWPGVPAVVNGITYQLEAYKG